MWEPLVVNQSQFNKISLQSILADKIPAIVIRNFYDEKSCQRVASRIENYDQNEFSKWKIKAHRAISNGSYNGQEKIL